MLSCDACPVKKMLPLDRLATANPCLGDFQNCPLFKELMVRLSAMQEEAVGAVSGRPDGRIGRER